MIYYLATSGTKSYIVGGLDAKVSVCGKKSLKGFKDHTQTPSLEQIEALTEGSRNFYRDLPRNYVIVLGHNIQTAQRLLLAGEEFIIVDKVAPSNPKHYKGFIVNIGNGQTAFIGINRNHKYKVVMDWEVPDAAPIVEPTLTPQV